MTLRHRPRTPVVFPHETRVGHASRTAGVASVLALVLVGMSGCTGRRAAGREDRPARSTERGTASSTLPPGALEPDAGERWITEAPTAGSGALGACIRRLRTGTPPELATALSSLEYPSVAEDACRLSLAAASADPALCDAVALSSLREVCRARAAMALGSRDACPNATAPVRGRDPTCVAIALRNPALCAAAVSHDRIRCEAIARRAIARCDELDPLLRGRCREDVTALRAHRSTARPTPTADALTASVRIVVHATREPDGGAAAVVDTVLAGHALGAFVTPEPMLHLVDPYRGWPSLTAFDLSSRQPVVGIAIGLPARPGDGRVERARIVLADGRALEAPAGATAGTVRFTRVSAVAGGTIEGSAELTLFATGLPYRVHLDFHTFVRDVVDPVVLGNDPTVAPAPRN